MASFLPDMKSMYAKLFGLPESSPLLPKLVAGQGVDFATKAAALQRALDEAKVLRAKGLRDNSAGEMVSGHYVPNYGGMISGLGSAIIGGMREKDLSKQAAEVAAAQQAEQSRLLGEMPTGTAASPEQPLVGPRPPVDVPVEGMQLGPLPQAEGPPEMLPAQPFKPPTQQEIMAWASQMQRVNPKLADAVSGKVMEGNIEQMFKKPPGLRTVGDSVLDEATGKWREPSPLQQARLQEARDLKVMDLAQRAEAARTRSEDARFSATERAAAARDSLELRREIANMSNETRRAIASASEGGKAARAAAAVTEGPKLSAKERSDANARSGQIASIDAALAAVDDPDNDAAFGLRQGGLESIGGPVQAFARDRLTTGQMRARDKVFNIAGDFIHQRYGAALSKQEAARGESYLPSLHDRPRVVASKLRNLKEFIQEWDGKLKPKEITTVPGAAAPPAPAAAPTSVDDLLKRYGG